jgi:radical SAM superfamily enzyme YgiQ (UPF0313 family)
LHDLGIQVYASFILRPEFTKDDFRSLHRFCRQQELSFASYAVLTPLPGTDLYDQVESELILHNYDYFDFIHTLLPTKLPLKEFYKEYHDLYFKGIKPTKQIEFLSKYPVKELPRTLLDSRKFYQRLKRAYLDYDDLPTIQKIA